MFVNHNCYLFFKIYQSYARKSFNSCTRLEKWNKIYSSLTVIFQFQRRKTFAIFNDSSVLRRTIILKSKVCSGWLVNKPLTIKHWQKTLESYRILICRKILIVTQLINISKFNLFLELDWLLDRQCCMTVNNS